MVDGSDIIDFEIQNEGMTLAIKKPEALQENIQFVQGPAMAPSAPMMTQLPAMNVGPPPTPSETPKSASQEPSPDAVPEISTPEGLQIVSPMAGTYYSAPAPGEPAFVKEGDRISKGQTVCIVEAMKLMNEIEAEISGEVIKILVQNGEAITAGQALMIVNPT